MASNTLPSPLQLLTETEAEVLELYDKLQQLQLELALLRSQQSHHVSGRDSQVAEPGMAGSQTQLLEAKATLSLRNSVVESAVAVQPTLNAVHRANHASPVERELLPYTEQRDVAAVRTVKISSDVQAARGRLAELEVESLRTSHQNIRLASEALQLAGKASNHQPAVGRGGRLERETAALEGQQKASHHRWRVMKGAASAIVAGSGIEWVRDERLRDLVVDPPD